MIHFQKVDFERINQNISNLKDIFEKYTNKIAAVYFFGSISSGRIMPLSDIDIAVLFDRNARIDEIKIIENDIYDELSKILRTNEIDLVILNNASLSIRYGVLKNKTLFFCSDREQVIEFENSTILKYLDFKPLREELNREFISTLHKVYSLKDFTM